MKIIRTIRTVLQALQRNLMRAMLTTQGVVIGVAAVIARWKSAKDRPRLSKSPLPVWAPTPFSFIQEPQIVEAISFGAGSGMNLLPQDYEAIVRECLQFVAPLRWCEHELSWFTETGTCLLQLITSLLEVRDWTSLAEGDVFSDRDGLNANKVCMPDQTLVRELFQRESPVGKEIRIKNVSFWVVGVLTGKGANMMGSDQDDILLAPWTTIK